ncbi:MAG: hypothetical protein ACK5CA_13010 [Cyanobacteriota bacterium]|jgi:hypothetical protein
MISSRSLPKLGASLTLFGSLTLAALPTLAIDNFTGPYAPTEWQPTAGAAIATAEFNGTEQADTFTVEFDSGSEGQYIERTISINLARAGTINFNWSFESADTEGTQSAGYTLNNDYITLVTADGTADVLSGAVPPVFVQEGDTFGFRFTALEDSSSSGYFSVTDFNVQPVPLETDALPVLIGSAFFGLGVWVKRRANLS